MRPLQARWTSPSESGKRLLQRSSIDGVVQRFAIAAQLSGESSSKESARRASDVWLAPRLPGSSAPVCPNRFLALERAAGVEERTRAYLQGIPGAAGDAAFSLFFALTTAVSRPRRSCDQPGLFGRQDSAQRAVHLRAWAPELGGPGCRGRNRGRELADLASPGLCAKHPFYARFASLAVSWPHLPTLWSHLKLGVPIGSRFSRGDFVHFHSLFLARSARHSADTDRVERYASSHVRPRDRIRDRSSHRAGDRRGQPRERGIRGSPASGSCSHFRCAATSSLRTSDRVSLHPRPGVQRSDSFLAYIAFLQLFDTSQV